MPSPDSTPTPHPEPSSPHVLVLNDIDYDTFSESPSPSPNPLTPDDLDAALQLVNDNNHVGPGHDANIRPYVCAYEDCTKAFARKSDLARHFRIHTGDKPYMCSYRECGKSFIQRSALTVHIRTHTGEKPHHCETCNKAFADSSSLARHRRIHTGKRPYTCPVSGCSRAFARRNTFLKHHKRSHPELSAPSTNPSRHPIHFPVRNRSFAGHSGNSEDLYLSPPHGFAASQPPQGAAFSFSGGFGAQPTQPHLIGGGGVGGVGRHGSGVGGRAPLHLSASSTIVRTPSSAGLQAVHTPVSASSSFYDGSGFGSPATPYSGTVESHQSHANTGGHQGGHVGHQVHQHQPVFRSVSANALPPPPPGMMWYRAGNIAPRAVSTPTPGFSSMPLGVAGFSADQLSIPINNQQQMLSSYYPTSNETTREGSPDLVDVNAVPSINVQQHDQSGQQQQQQPPQPSHSPMPGPFSAVMPQYATMPHPMPGRLHSAPPFLTRFHSSPQVPTTASWTVDPYSGPGGYGDAHSLGGGRSGEDEDWEELEEQMLSRDVSAGPEESTPPVDTQQMGDALPKSQWEAPIAFPANPREPSRVFSSSASVASTSSTLVNSNDAPNHNLPPLTIYPHQSVSPMIYTPIQGQHAYYTTPTTASWETPDFKYQQPLYNQYALQSPAVILPPRDAYTYQPMQSPAVPSQNVHNITLTTPPRFERKDTSVSAVGLGIANVTFGDASPTELLSDDGMEEDLDAGEDSDSDDEFVPGGRGKPRRKLASKKKGKGFTTKQRKRQHV